MRCRGVPLTAGAACLQDAEDVARGAPASYNDGPSGISLVGGRGVGRTGRWRGSCTGFVGATGRREMSRLYLLEDLFYLFATIVGTVSLYLRVLSQWFCECVMY